MTTGGKDQGVLIWLLLLWPCQPVLSIPALARPLRKTSLSPIRFYIRCGGEHAGSQTLHVIQAKTKALAQQTLEGIVFEHSNVFDSSEMISTTGEMCIVIGKLAGVRSMTVAASNKPSFHLLHLVSLFEEHSLSSFARERVYPQSLSNCARHIHPTPRPRQPLYSAKTRLGEIPLFGVGWTERRRSRKTGQLPASPLIKGCRRARCPTLLGSSSPIRNASPVPPPVPSLEPSAPQPHRTADDANEGAKWMLEDGM